MARGTLLDERDIAALVDSFDELAAGAKSFFPGRVLVNRKKAQDLLDRIVEKLGDKEGSKSTALFAQACDAVEELDILVTTTGYAGPSIWRLWFVDVRRKRIANKLEELRAALTPFMD